MSERTRGIVSIVIGVVVIVVGIGLLFNDKSTMGAILVLTGACFAIGRNLRLKSKLGEIDTTIVKFESFREIEQITIQPKSLEPEEEQHRRESTKDIHLPGADAPEFNLLQELPAFNAMPGADPMVPMYRLDSNFRIMDWNEAFSLVFDRTLEGRRGQSAVEWVYFLDNWEEVLTHGVEKFSDPANIPNFDIEPIEYASSRYGKLTAMKRAYKIPNDDETCLGWVLTLDLDFKEKIQFHRFQFDLVNVLRNNLTWSEYAFSYDRVLTKTKVYPELLQAMIGGSNGLPEIPPQSRVLDLGAGTGNLTAMLADPVKRRLVVAIENNRTMLASLEQKCKPFLNSGDKEEGVMAHRQDAGSLFGLQDNFFDYVLLNNVLYCLDDWMATLREIYRVLKPGQEVRISGPHESTNLDQLFGQIQKDLISSGQYESVHNDYERVKKINEYHLAPLFPKWTVKDVQQMLTDVGFSQLGFATEKAYAGQAMIVSALK